MKRLFTSESVTEGHPDKVSDRISDSVLDAICTEAPFSTVACETFVTTDLVLVGGEITTTAKVDVEHIVRNAVKDIGYIHDGEGFHYDTCEVINRIHEQSPDINQAVVKAKDDTDFDSVGAGDQGMMFGFACNQTPDYMPLPIALAHALTRQLARVRKDGVLDYIRPDGKTQVSVQYDGDQPVRVENVVISTQHAEDVSMEQMEKDLVEHVIRPVLGEWFNDQINLFINPSGRFVVGGPHGDAGLTGRKIIVDTYGGYAAHGGGAFSGKDPSKVDRTGAYMARYVAKNIVAAGLANWCELQVAYAIGVPQPVSITTQTNKGAPLSNNQLVEIVREHFDFRPAAIIHNFDLRRPIYQQLSAYGHFGRNDLNLPWEQLDKVEALKEAAGALSR